MPTERFYIKKKYSKEHTNEIKAKEIAVKIHKNDAKTLVKNKTLAKAPHQPTISNPNFDTCKSRLRLQTGLKNGARNSASHQLFSLHQNSGYTFPINYIPLTPHARPAMET